MTSDQFDRWIKGRGYTAQTAGEALGLTKRAVEGMRQGEYRIPGPVALLCAYIDEHGILGGVDERGQ